MCIRDRRRVHGNALSTLSLQNLGEYFIGQGRFAEAIFYLKTALHLSVTLRAPPKTLRTMVLLAMVTEINEKPELAEKLYLDCLEFMQGTMTYNKLFALEMYANFLKSNKRDYESEEMRRQAEAIRSSFPYWYERRDCLQFPELNLIAKQTVLKCVSFALGLSSSTSIPMIPLMIFVIIYAVSMSPGSNTLQSCEK
eukprot:TRINITY_DN4810_c0_g1_i1.p1 TRINITY_DN4810_c0_g1~~TRINITY_DN4810_c0_g1_i1.p1  ORF type:complete len:196 (+),score=29.56 TRINITY_DN4810_c0_g1_i1:64-651(+)